MSDRTQPTAVITGGSRGLGRALSHALADQGWRLVIDARRAEDLAAVAARLPGALAIPGDVTDPAHREALLHAVDSLDLLVNNASDLGPAPLPPLASYPLDGLRHVYETDVVAPLALTQLLLPKLRVANGIVVNISSDAAVEAYPGWGGYGSAKAALDHISAVLAAEDIGDRPVPESVVPALLALLADRPVSGRFRLADVAVPA